MKHSTISIAVQEKLAELGNRIAVARRRRDWTQADFAKRIGVSRATLGRLERGEGGIGLEVAVCALWALGLEHTLNAVAAVETDQVGIFHEARKHRQRVRHTENERLNF